MATTPQTEARSLSAINYLAANPPQYPYHPEVREPLTLYISRVPGTQGASHGHIGHTDQLLIRNV